MKFYFDKMPVRILYTDKQVDSCLDEFIKNLERKEFSFSQVSRYLIDKSDEDGKLNKEEDTIYNSGIILTDEDGQRLSKSLWKKILEGKIFVDFHRNPYSVIPQRDCLFVVNK